MEYESRWFWEDSSATNRTVITKAILLKEYKELWNSATEVNYITVDEIARREKIFKNPPKFY